MSQNWPTMWGIVDIDADSHRVIMKVESHDGITTIRPQIDLGILGDLCLEVATHDLRAAL